MVWLDLWERALPQPPRLRRRELLAFSGQPAAPPSASAPPRPALAADQLEIGRANARLLELHRSMFGPRLSCRTACEACGAGLELDLDGEELLSRAPAQPAQPMRLEVAPWDIAFRLPTEGDIDAVQAERDVSLARDTILQRCVTRCCRGGEETPISQAPPEVIALMTARMEESDPLATLDFELRCAGCDHVWSSTLDVDGFLWTRLDTWTRRLLRDVHAIARVYGWNERTITEMSPWKRQLYLDMVEECATS